MTVEFTIDHESPAGGIYLTWAPVRATIRLLDGDPVTLTVRNANPAAGGQVEFARQRNQPRTATLDLALSAGGGPVEFWVAGVVGRPSSSDGDAVIQVTRAGAAAPLASRPAMVRVRKDANTLSAAERNRFTTALATLNDRGTGLFRNFRDMHRDQLALNQAHGAPGFLSWHRAYLLDLERELQRITPSVTLPYWRFDRPAPNVFSPDLMGSSGSMGNVAFSPANLLRQWRTDGAPGISRRPLFNVQTRGASVSADAVTLGLGGRRPNAIFDNGTDSGGFDDMEGNPHGRAHTSFNGWIRSADTAPRDPLFFLLHCNVDRLWARWQWFNNRFNGTQPNTYFFRGSATSTPATDIGHNLRDTMWPWNGVTGFPRPNNAPRNQFPPGPTAPAPGLAPTVGDMIDYQGLLNPQSYMNFAYDDVPYGVAP